MFIKKNLLHTNFTLNISIFTNLSHLASVIILPSRCLLWIKKMLHKENVSHIKVTLILCKIICFYISAVHFCILINQPREHKIMVILEYLTWAAFISRSNCCKIFNGYVQLCVWLIQHFFCFDVSFYLVLIIYHKYICNIFNAKCLLWC